MQQLLNIAIDDNDHVLLEIDAPAGVVPAGAGRIAGATGQTIEQVFTRIQPVVRSIADKIRSLPERPDRVCVEFGVTLNAEADVVIARTATEANFRLTVEWQRAPRAEEQPATSDPE